MEEGPPRVEGQRRAEGQPRIPLEGEVVEGKPLEFYRGEFYHYADNFGLSESSTYTLKAEIAPPTFLRQGTEEGEGRVLIEPVVAKFETVQISTEGG